MKKTRLSARLSTTAKDLLTQIAGALGLTLTGALEVAIREKALALRLRPRPTPELVTHGEEIDSD